MGKKNVIIEEPEVETPVVETPAVETPAVETPWEGHPSRDFNS